MAEFICPKCGYETKQPALKGAVYYHQCPKGRKFKERTKLKEKK